MCLFDFLFIYFLDKLVCFLTKQKQKIGVLWLSTLKPFENYQATYNVSYEQIASTFVALLKTCWQMDSTLR